MFWELRTWKQTLLNELNAGVLIEVAWQKFIKLAEENCCYAMAADMKNRLDHYEKAEKVCS